MPWAYVSSYLCWSAFCASVEPSLARSMSVGPRPIEYVPHAARRTSTTAMEAFMARMARTLEQKQPRDPCGREQAREVAREPGPQGVANALDADGAEVHGEDVER